MATVENYYVSFLFSYLFPDYATFNSKITDTDLNGVYGITLDSGIKEYIYAVLKRQYWNTPVINGTPDIFYDTFQSYYTDYAGKVNREVQLIKKIYSLSDDELLLLSDSIVNSSLNPNDAPTDITKPLTFVSSQIYSHNSQPKLNAFLTALANLPTLKEREIVEYFRPLFYNVYNGEVVYDDTTN